MQNIGQYRPLVILFVLICWISGPGFIGDTTALVDAATTSAPCNKPEKLPPCSSWLSNPGCIQNGRHVGAYCKEGTVNRCHCWGFCGYICERSTLCGALTNCAEGTSSSTTRRPPTTGSTRPPTSRPTGSTRPPTSRPTGSTRPPTPTPTSGPGTTRPEFCAGQANFRQAALELHNSYRARHGSPALTLDDSLNNKAQLYAEKLARDGTFGHSGPGENLYAATAAIPAIPDCATHTKQATKLWYDEISLYDFNNPGFSAATGHFTQVVWKATSKLGIGIARNVGTSNQRIVVVANYEPPGNVNGQFPENVQRAN